MCVFASLDIWHTKTCTTKKCKSIDMHKSKFGRYCDLWRKTIACQDTLDIEVRHSTRHVKSSWRHFKVKCRGQIDIHSKKKKSKIYITWHHKGGNSWGGLYITCDQKGIIACVHIKLHSVISSLIPQNPREQNLIMGERRWATSCDSNETLVHYIWNITGLLMEVNYRLWMNLSFMWTL